MVEEKNYKFYDYLFSVISAESRYWEYDYVYEEAEKEFANMLFPDDDERNYQFQSFYELHVGRLEKDGLIVVKFKNEKPIEIGLSDAGKHACSLGGYLQYKNEQEDAIKRAEDEKRLRKQEESNERKWNIRNNKVQTILGIISCLSLISGWVLERIDNSLFATTIFIAGCLLGYGLGSRIKKHRNFNNLDG